MLDFKNEVMGFHVRNVIAGMEQARQQVFLA